MPTPEAIPGSEVEAKRDGSVCRLVRYTEAGYRVAYGRATCDEPPTIITTRKMS